MATQLGSIGLFSGHACEGEPVSRGMATIFYFTPLIGEEQTMKFDSSRKMIMTIAIGVLIASFVGVQSALAVPTIAYEHTEGANSQVVSFHNANGPVLADDFTPSVSGQVIQVDWWGTATNNSLFEITFHTDTLDPGPPASHHEPAITLPSGGISQHFVNSGGVDPDMDGIFFYSAAWSPQDVAISVGTDYWFSVANGFNNWTWATGTVGGPTVGSEMFIPVVSVDGAPSVISGPHDGPWNPLIDQPSFAFRIWVDAVPPPTIPEPLTASLGMMGLGAIAATLQRRNSCG